MLSTMLSELPLATGYHCVNAQNLCFESVDCNAWWGPPGNFTAGGLRFTDHGQPGDPLATCTELNGWGLALEVFVVVYSFIGLAIVCDDYLVMSLETLCIRCNIREDIAGASFMAFGSAAPEIIVNAVSTLKSNTGGSPQAASLGVGAILGSGVIAFSFIPGMCGLLSGRDELRLKRRPLARDTLTYTLCLVLLCQFFSDGIIQVYEALCLLVAYV